MPNQILYFKTDVYKKLVLEENMSSIVDKLLRDHYEIEKQKSMTLEEVNKELAKIKLEKEFKEKVEVLNNAN